MTDVAALPKRDLFGVTVTPTTYAQAVQAVVTAAEEHRSLTVTALATHGLMEAAHDPEFREVVNGIDIVTPDGQPVRWALNLLHRSGLTDRVYGPDLTREVLAEMERRDLAAFFFGSTTETCERMISRIRRTHPRLRVAGYQADRFREATPAEALADARTITESGADVVFCGRGCPRQERWVHGHRDRIHRPMLAVGAAFDYLAGNLERPPGWMQRAGLEWLARLCQEPRRLWRRYLVTNSQYLYLLAGAYLRGRRPPKESR